MADSIRILGTSTPGTTHTNLFVCGKRSDATTDSLRGFRPGVQAVVSSIVVCETNNASATITISVVPDGETRAAAYEIFSTYAIGARDTKIISAGITLNQGDKITVYASTSTVNFFAFGAETG